MHSITTDLAARGRPAHEGRTGRRWLAALLAAVSVAGLVACGGDDDEDEEQARADDPMPAATAPMKAVLDELAALGAKPIDTLTVQQARTQPTPADAVRSVLVKQGRSTAPEPVGSVQDSTIPGPAGPLPVRIYKPAGTGPFPVLHYIHGGGWVIATIDTYDASARALANAAGAIVVSTEYRKAPEAPFPAAHEDTYAAWKWLVANAASLGGIPSRIAVAGESAGGDMAASIAIRARDDRIQQPVHQLLVYPVVDAALDSPSERQNRDAMPLNTPSLGWFYDKYLPQPSDRNDRRFALNATGDLRGLPSATVITADIDPLRSEGRAYAERLNDARVNVRWVNYAGVTHEFFGMTAVVPEAGAAVATAGADLRAAFERTPR